MMFERVVAWLWRRLRPRAGWITFALLLVAVMTVAGSIQTAAWVRELDSTYTIAFWALILTLVLVQRGVRGWFAAPLLAGYGIVLITIVLSKAWPSAQIWSGWPASAVHIRLNLILYWTRLQTWIEAAQAGRSTRETIFFATLILALLWLLTCLAVWSSLRWYKPLHALSLLGLALLINNYYGDVSYVAAGVFVLVTVLLTTVIHFDALVLRWQAAGVDYSDEIRIEMLGLAAAIAVVLVMVAALLPAIPYRDLSRAFRRSESVNQAEETLGRVFAGVEQPAAGGSSGGGSQPGVFPRAFLLGNAPELHETAVLAAQTDAPIPAGYHWRGLSYDIYAGSGWSRSAEADVTVLAGAELGWTPVADTLRLRQTVIWAEEAAPGLALTIGRPLTFDQPVTAHWRGPDDLAYIGAVDSRYEVTSALPRLSAAGLRAATLAGVPADLLQHYTTLPATVPDRVHELAEEITGRYNNPYAQAGAIEAFLRQYTYSLAPGTLPPAGRDPVDYFLFDLKQGYCDYYASAMVVLARSAGLPARFATGYNVQPADASGTQTVYQINAHSWAEIYFAGYGWVEFEPTSGFAQLPPAGEQTASSNPLDDPFALPDEFLGSVPPIPTDTEAALSSWWFVGGILLLLGLAGAGWYLWGRQPAGVDGYSYAYGRLRGHWGQVAGEADPSLTPLEFGGLLEEAMVELRAGSLRPAGWWQRRVLAERFYLRQLVNQ
ncbi:MAG: transglutaminase domain-containing protein, partial [Anaerolineales bacterium]|nr:transglutaminase domain-containing protein [Anaerolineales bacterium]